jgi:hypothetical protein
MGTVRSVGVLWAKGGNDLGWTCRPIHPSSRMAIRIPATVRIIFNKRTIEIYSSEIQVGFMK